MIAAAWEIFPLHGAPASPPVTVLGVGNPIMADDGTGPALLDRVRATRPDPRIAYIDGGTDGMGLIPVIEGVHRLLVLDAVTVAGQTPGTAVRLPGSQLRAHLGAKMSPHQVGLLDALNATTLLDRAPREIQVVGVVPERVELSIGLSPAVAAGIAAAADLAVSVLDEWLELV
jgi:hydrogenase maturation protease